MKINIHEHIESSNKTLKFRNKTRIYVAVRYKESLEIDPFYGTKECKIRLWLFTSLIL